MIESSTLSLPRTLVLVGMMGAGKTTIGRLIARRLKRQFLDSDHEIERRCGVRLAVIFDIEGEAGFRQREAEVLDELSERSGIVLATGGGAILASANRERLAARHEPHDGERLAGTIDRIVSDPGRMAAMAAASAGLGKPDASSQIAMRLVELATRQGRLSKLGTVLSDLCSVR